MDCALKHIVDIHLTLINEKLIRQLIGKTFGKPGVCAANSCSRWTLLPEFKIRKHIVKGHENASQAFIGGFKGKHFGKLIVRISND